MKKALLVALAILVISALCILAGCDDAKSSSNGIVGSWAHDGWVYTFNEDGTGDYSGSQITYNTSGDIINIYYFGSTYPTSLNYKIEGKQLIITDSFGTDVIYEKK